MMLENPTAKTQNQEKSVIYEIIYNHCNEKYHGQSQNNFRISYGKHFVHTKYSRNVKSCAAHLVKDRLLIQVRYN